MTAAAGCMAVGLLGGCRNLDNAQVDVLERELRQQEDYIYELEDYLIEYSEKLRQARLAQCPPGASPPSRTGSKTRAPLPEPTIDEDEIQRSTLPLNGRDKLTTPPSEAPPAATEAPPAAAPAEAPPSAPPADEVNPEELEAPELQIGPIGNASQQSEPIAANDAALNSTEAEGPLLIPDPIDYQADADAESTSDVEPGPAVADAASEPTLAAPEVNAPRLTAHQLVVRRLFREPSSDGASPGSLLVVVEGVNATDEPADVVGAASLMVMARDENGDLRRVDRWDFTAEETAAAWQSSHLGDGLHLALPLTEEELPEGELELWARVVGDGGAKLLTSADDPFRFEAGKLVALADAPADTMLASTEASPLEPTPAESEPTAPSDGIDNAAEAATTTAAAEAPKPQWRASSIRLDNDHVEGFATTAGNKPASWTTTPIDGGQARVATSSGNTSTPKWQRSTRAAVMTESKPEWSAER
ncbi:MAG TPA: hypothetical protein VF175_01425 [Lacipirellula sp.]